MNYMKKKRIGFVKLKGKTERLRKKSTLMYNASQVMPEVIAFVNQCRYTNMQGAFTPERLVNYVHEHICANIREVITEKTGIKSAGVQYPSGEEVQRMLELSVKEQISPTDSVKTFKLDEEMCRNYKFKIAYDYFIPGKSHRKRLSIKCLQSKELRSRDGMV